MRENNIKMVARLAVLVDDVDIEQVKIERQNLKMKDRDAAVAAAWENPDISGLRKLAARNKIPMGVKAARPTGSNFWKVIFLIGKKEFDNEMA